MAEENKTTNPQDNPREQSSVGPSLGEDQKTVANFSNVQFLEIQDSEDEAAQLAESEDEHLYGGEGPSVGPASQENDRLPDADEEWLEPAAQAPWSPPQKKSRKDRKKKKQSGPVDDGASTKEAKPAEEPPANATDKQATTPDDDFTKSPSGKKSKNAKTNAKKALKHKADKAKSPGKRNKSVSFANPPAVEQKEPEPETHEAEERPDEAAPAASEPAADDAAKDTEEPAPTPEASSAASEASEPAADVPAEAASEEQPPVVEATEESKEATPPSDQLSEPSPVADDPEPSIEASTEPPKEDKASTQEETPSAQSDEATAESTSTDAAAPEKLADDAAAVSEAATEAKSEPDTSEAADTTDQEKPVEPAVPVEPAPEVEKEPEPEPEAVSTQETTAEAAEAAAGDDAEPAQNDDTPAEEPSESSESKPEVVAESQGSSPAAEKATEEKAETEAPNEMPLAAEGDLNMTEVEVEAHDDDKDEAPAKTEETKDSPEPAESVSKPDVEESEEKPAEGTEANTEPDVANADEPVVEGAAAETAVTSEEVSEAAEQPKKPEVTESDDAAPAKEESLPQEAAPGSEAASAEKDEVPASTSSESDDAPKAEENSPAEEASAEEKTEAKDTTEADVTSAPPAVEDAPDEPVSSVANAIAAADNAEPTEKEESPPEPFVTAGEEETCPEKKLEDDIKSDTTEAQEPVDDNKTEDTASSAGAIAEKDSTELAENSVDDKTAQSEESPAETQTPSDSNVEQGAESAESAGVASDTPVPATDVSQETEEVREQSALDDQPKVPEAEAGPEDGGKDESKATSEPVDAVEEPAAAPAIETPAVENDDSGSKHEASDEAAPADTEPPAGADPSADATNEVSDDAQGDSHPADGAEEKATEVVTEGPSQEVTVPDTGAGDEAKEAAPADDTVEEAASVPATDEDTPKEMVSVPAADDKTTDSVLPDNKESTAEEQTTSTEAADKSTDTDSPASPDEEAAATEEAAKEEEIASPPPDDTKSTSDDTEGDQDEASTAEVAKPEATSTAVDEMAAPAIEKSNSEAQKPEETTTEEVPKTANGDSSEIVEPEEHKAGPETEAEPPTEEKNEESVTAPSVEDAAEKANDDTPQEHSDSIVPTEVAREAETEKPSADEEAVKDTADSTEKGDSDKTEETSAPEIDEESAIAEEKTEPEIVEVAADAETAAPEPEAEPEATEETPKPEDTSAEATAVAAAKEEEAQPETSDAAASPSDEPHVEATTDAQDGDKPSEEPAKETTAQSDELSEGTAKDSEATANDKAAPVTDDAPAVVVEEPEKSEAEAPIAEKPEAKADAETEAEPEAEPEPPTVESEPKPTTDDSAGEHEAIVEKDAEKAPEETEPAEKAGEEPPAAQDVVEAPPATAEAAADSPAADEPAEEPPTATEPAEPAPAAEEVVEESKKAPAAEEAPAPSPAAEAPAEEKTAETPGVDEKAAEAPTAEGEPSAVDASVDTPAADAPAVEEQAPAVDEKATAAAVVEEEQPTAEVPPAAEKLPTAEEPATEAPAAEEPAAEEPTAEEPAAEEPAAEEPAAEEPADAPAEAPVEAVPEPTAAEEKAAEAPTANEEATEPSTGEAPVEEVATTEKEVEQAPGGSENTEETPVAAEEKASERATEQVEATPAAETVKKADAEPTVIADAAPAVASAETVPDPIPEEKAAQPAEEEPSSDKTLPAEGKDVKSAGDEEEAKDKVGPMPSSEKGSKGKQQFHIRVADPSGFMASESGGSGPESDLVEEDYPQDELIAQHVEEVGTTEDELAATGTHSKDIPSDSDPGQDPAASEPLSSILDQAEQPDALDIHAPAPEMPSGSLSGSHESGNQETHVLHRIESAQPITDSSGADSLGHGGVLVDAASSDPGSDRHQQPSLAAPPQDLTLKKDESDATDPLAKDISRPGVIPSNTVPDDPSANVVMESDMIKVQGSATPVNQDTFEVVGHEELPETVDQNISGPELHDKDDSSPLQASLTHQLVPEETTMAPPEEKQDQSLAAQDSEVSQIPDTAAVTDAELAIPGSDSRHGQDQERSEVLGQDLTPRDPAQIAASSTEQVKSLDPAMSIENSLDEESSPANTASASEQDQHHHADITESIEPDESQSAREIPVFESNIISDAELEPTAPYQAPDAANTTDTLQDAEDPQSPELLETLPPLEGQQAQVDAAVQHSGTVPATSEELPSHDLERPQLAEPTASSGSVPQEPLESSAQKSSPVQHRLLVGSEAPENSSALNQPIHDEVADDDRPIDAAQEQDVLQESEPTFATDQLETGSLPAEETQKDSVVEELPILPDESQAQHHIAETTPELADSHVDVPENLWDGSLDQSPEASPISTQEPQAYVEHDIDPTSAPEVKAEDEAAGVHHHIDNASLLSPDLPATDQVVASTMDSEHAIRAEPIEDLVGRQESVPVSDPVHEFPEAAMRDLDIPTVENRTAAKPVEGLDEAAASAEEPKSLMSTMEYSDTGTRGDSVLADPSPEHVEVTQDPPVVDIDDKVLSSPPNAIVSSEKLTEDVAPSNSELNGSESFIQEQSDPQETLMEPVALQESPFLVQETVQPHASGDTALLEITTGSEVAAEDLSASKSDLSHTMAEPSENLPEEVIESSMSQKRPVDRHLPVENQPKLDLEPQEAPSAASLFIDERSEPAQSAAVQAQDEPLPEEPQNAMASTTETHETVMVGDHAVKESATAQPEDPPTERSPDVSQAGEVSTDLAEAPESQAPLDVVQQEVLRDGDQAPTSLPQDVKLGDSTKDLPGQSSAELHDKSVDLPSSVERDESEAVGADVQTIDALGGSQQLATENLEDSESAKEYLPETDEKSHVALDSDDAEADSQDHSVETSTAPQDCLPDSGAKALADDLSAEGPQSAVTEESQILQESEIDTSEQDSTHSSPDKDEAAGHQGLTAGIAAGAAAITAGAGALASQLFTSRHAGEPSKDDTPRQLCELPQSNDAPMVPLKSPARSFSSESSREEENYTLDDDPTLEHHSSLHEAAVPRSVGQTSIMSQLPPKAALKEHRPRNAAYPSPPELPTNHNQTVLEGTTRDSLIRPILDHSGTQTGRDSDSSLPAPPSPGNAGGLMSTRSLTPGIVLPDLSDPTARALGRARSLRRSRRRTIRMNEETVAAAVIIYATASNMGSSSDSRLGSAQIEASISRSQDLAIRLEAGVQGVELTDVYNSVTDKPSTDDEDKKSSERRRRRRHSKSAEAKPEEVKEETRHKRRVSIASSKSDTSNLVTPSRTDSGLSESSRSTKPRRHRTADEQAAHEARKRQRTPEEQADHDRRKAERRARHEKEREQEADKGKDPEIPQSRRHSHHSHGSSKRDSTQSASSNRPERTPRSVDTPSTPPKKSIFSFRSAESAVTPNLPSRASEPSVPRASKEATRPDSARRSNTTRDAPTRKAPDAPKPEDDGSKAREREHRSPRERDHSHHHRPHRPREQSPDTPKAASGTAKEVEDSSPPNGADAEKPRERRPPRAERREHREHREDKRERNYRREERQRTRDMEAKKQAAPAATTGFKGIFKKLFA